MHLTKFATKTLAIAIIPFALGAETPPEFRQEFPGSLRAPHNVNPYRVTQDAPPYMPRPAHPAHSITPDMLQAARARLKKAHVGPGGSNSRGPPPPRPARNPKRLTDAQNRGGSRGNPPPRPPRSAKRNTGGASGSGSGSRRRSLDEDEELDLLVRGLGLDGLFERDLGEDIYDFEGRDAEAEAELWAEEEFAY